MFDKPYKVCFLHKEFGTIFLSRVIYPTSRNDVLKVGTKSFVIDWNLPAFNTQKQKTYLVDADTGAQLNYNEVKTQLNPNELDTIVSNKLIRELAQGLMNNSKEKLLWFVLGAIIGALVAALIVMGIFQEKITELLSGTQIINVDGQGIAF